ncbi:MAG: HIT family protein [Candidatus Rokuibacteriota bacterium]
MTADDCPACAGRWPRADHRIAELGHSLAYLHEDQFFPGWTLLGLKRHATELFDLTREERAELIEEVSGVAQVLAASFSALKINYELLGNQIPHIHWHVVPRLPGDPAPRGPVWLVEHAPRPLSPDELSERIQRIRSGLR